MLDLLIRDGMIIDGTGNPGFYGAVGVEDERVAILRGDLVGIEARRVIDATGRVVCPGFIDMHAHSGLVILAEPLHEPKVRQGVTTELIGIDGCSYAPFTTEVDFRRFVEIDSGLDGNPPLPGRWSTVEQYLDMFTRRVAVNIVYILGNSPLRIAGVGWDRPSRHRAREGEHEGVAPNRDGRGGSRHVDRARLPARELRRHGGAGRAVPGGGATRWHLPHPRRYSLGDRFLDPSGEALTSAAAAGVP